MVTRSSVSKPSPPPRGAPLTARMVALRLGIGLSTLNGWLAADEARPVPERRFHYHVFHGRKRLWTEDRFDCLRLAIETESEPGGLLATWRRDDRPGRDDRAAMSRDAEAATEAMARVFAFYEETPGGEERRTIAEDPTDPDVETERWPRP